MKQVIIVRKDLNMRKGKMIAQGAHASVTAIFDHIMDNRVQEWMSSGQTKICLGCDSEQELLDLYQRARQAKMLVSLIKDAGKTEFNGVPTLTAVAIGPANEQDVDKITGHLKLL